MRTKSANRIVAVALAAVLLVPAILFAETTPALTRDQVRAELRQLEQAGYEPAASHDARYPADLQIAEATVAARNTAVQASAAGLSYRTSMSAWAEAGAAPTQSSVSK
ncbi:uncharacterized protein DUF4148 [Paraburkholderia sp. BL23I1N1]|uniref:DUF4148 domain-containing protein n=1 Tax=Paraburkholderia sp. BL23I1N1 TaxID=1938802 RepID=UPI000FF4FD31|nr:DUF4148 domain-containing protein [Paraburkholderia sp. BL23I1N1]RKE36389.1 uncharacterized protein DUF4148 [Paraburkholderia sp. BL23I1N1]